MPDREAKCLLPLGVRSPPLSTCSTLRRPHDACRFFPRRRRQSAFVGAHLTPAKTPRALRNEQSPLQAGYSRGNECSRRIAQRDSRAQPRRRFWPHQKRRPQTPPNPAARSEHARLDKCPAHAARSPCDWQALPVRRRLPHLVRRSEEHTSELQSRSDLVCRLLLEKK